MNFIGEGHAHLGDPDGSSWDVEGAGYSKLVIVAGATVKGVDTPRASIDVHFGTEYATIRGGGSLVKHQKPMI